MRYTAYSYTNRGGRENNEDSIRLFEDDERCVCVVCDGLGGHQSGEVASALASDSLVESCTALDTPAKEDVRDAIVRANEAVLAGQAEPDRSSMKTTAAVLTVFGDRAVWDYAGDTRIYHISNGKLVMQTPDHSVTYKKYLANEIRYMDIYHDDDRPSLLRVLGKSTCSPDVGEAKVAAGDAFLLCTDGFWEYVYNEEILIDRLKSATPEEWVGHMLQRHIRRTPPRNDNFSVIALFAGES